MLVKIPENDDDIKMTGVSESCENFPVCLGERNGRLVISAYNESGWNGTEIDLVELIAWLRVNRPDVLETNG